MSLSENPSPLELPPSLGRAIVVLRSHWGWIVAFGALSALLGLIALVLIFSATIASVYIIAIFMIIAGGTEITVGLNAKFWSHFFLWIVAGLCYIVVGALALAQPLMAAAFFTLLLGTGMIATGLVRIYFAFRLESEVRGPVLLAGVLTALVGILIVVGWPANSYFILGILLGLDLLFWGAGWIAIGLRLRHAHRLSLQ